MRITLLDNNDNIQEIAGLNWGQNPNNHTVTDDAYITIRSRFIRDPNNIFPPKGNNNTIRIVWDDGTEMNGLLEGNQTINGQVFPKQLSSTPHKNTLGLYLKNRLNVPSGMAIEPIHLQNYGRSDIDISVLDDGSYFFDFSI